MPCGLLAQSDIREESIYFLITSRFFDGDPSNNRPTEWCSWYKGASNNIKDTQDVTWRGDFKGLVRKLDYIKDLGVGPQGTFCVGSTGQGLAVAAARSGCRDVCAALRRAACGAYEQCRLTDLHHYFSFLFASLG